MNLIIYHKHTGDIVGFRQNAVDSELAFETDDLACMESDIPVGTTQFYVRNGQLASRPERPGLNYIWDGQAWVVDMPYASQMARMQRNDLLLACDWTETPSARTRLGETLYAQWQAYRQALREWPDQPGWPIDAPLPTPPA